MACARCDVLLPKESSKAQLLEAKDNLQRGRATIPLLERLANVPTPSGSAPRPLLPIIEVRGGTAEDG
ncbi:hypothetical protein ACIRBZ_39605 [Streptomyces sp. NPDC094038]|uniref:hypothetical protein n=1 Tax=Streptomyces sp. NPDC094038 TaxID=3366055 RepID=UPI00380CB51D